MPNFAADAGCLQWVIFARSGTRTGTSALLQTGHSVLATLAVVQWQRGNILLADDLQSKALALVPSVIRRYELSASEIGVQLDRSLAGGFHLQGIRVDEPAEFLCRT